MRNNFRFGNGSFVCCDGGMQFGVQDVPEVWERVCSEASVRRMQLPVLRGARTRLSQLMGNAYILTPPERSLAQTVDQIQVKNSSVIALLNLCLKFSLYVYC